MGETFSMAILPRVESSHEALVNPFRAPEPLSVLNPSNFVPTKRVSSCKGVEENRWLLELDLAESAKTLTKNKTNDKATYRIHNNYNTNLVSYIL